MTELNVYHHELRPNEYDEFYLKSEADKVIEKKDKSIILLQQSLQSADSVSSYRKRVIKEYEVTIDRMQTDISDKDKEIVQLQAMLEERNKQIGELKKACNSKDDWCFHTLKENRRHKYKRCLAMAEWCEERDHYLNSLENYQLTDKEYQQVISGCWDRRYKRWLELAKKANALCKEAK